MMEGLRQIGLGEVAVAELLSVRRGLRPACRWVLPTESIGPALEEVAGAELCAVVGFDCIVPMSDPASSDYSEWALARPARPGEPGQRCVYVGHDRRHLERLRRSEEAGQVAVSGQLMGYPRCCSAWFEVAGADSTQDPVVRSYADCAPIPWQMNVSLLPFDRALLSHVPCSETCRPSFEMALAHHRLLQDEFECGREIEQDLARWVLHSEEAGIISFDATRTSSGCVVTAVVQPEHASVEHAGLRVGSVLCHTPEGVAVDEAVLSARATRLFEFVKRESDR